MLPEDTDKDEGLRIGVEEARLEARLGAVEAAEDPKLPAPNILRMVSFERLLSKRPPPSKRLLRGSER